MLGWPDILTVHESCDPLTYCVVKVNPTVYEDHMTSNEGEYPTMINNLLTTIHYTIMM